MVKCNICLKEIDIKDSRYNAKDDVSYCTDCFDKLAKGDTIQLKDSASLNSLRQLAELQKMNSALIQSEIVEIAMVYDRAINRLLELQKDGY